MSLRFLASFVAAVAMFGSLPLWWWLQEKAAQAELTKQAAPAGEAEPLVTSAHDERMAVADAPTPPAQPDELSPTVPAETILEPEHETSAPAASVEPAAEPLPEPPGTPAVTHDAPAAPEPDPLPRRIATVAAD